MLSLYYTKEQKKLSASVLALTKRKQTLNLFQAPDIRIQKREIP
jgi:hypothetical protein